jgi:hypothetical protein
LFKADIGCIGFWHDRFPFRRLRVQLYVIVRTHEFVVS